MLFDQEDPLGGFVRAQGIVAVCCLEVRIGPA
jgi:hypothetical protein